MSADECLQPKQFTLYRGEGTHSRPSYYPKKGPEALAGAWWTTNVDTARKYASSTNEGKVYSLDVLHGSEAEQRGLPHNYVVRDPAVRARRKLL